MVGAVASLSNSQPRFDGTEISNNVAKRGGGGMKAEGAWGKPIIINCHFLWNRAALTGACGGGLMMDNGVGGLITKTDFVGNAALGSGGGICLAQGASPVVTDCIIANNTALVNNGGGMMADIGSKPRLIRCLFHGNTARKAGGGVSVQGAETNPYFEVNTIWSTVDCLKSKLHCLLTCLLACVCVCVGVCVCVCVCVYVCVCV